MYGTSKVSVCRRQFCVEQRAAAAVVIVWAPQQQVEHLQLLRGHQCVISAYEVCTNDSSTASWCALPLAEIDI